MKRKLFISCCMVFISINLFAQMNISTNLRQDFIWDEEKEEWNLLATNQEELTFFEFNKDFTMFKHTTPSATSAYMIKSSELIEEFQHYEFEIISDTGNKYLMILDEKNRNVRFLYENDGDLLMVHHTIKRLWSAEEGE